MTDQFGNNVHFINGFRCKGAVTCNEDGSYDIFIRADLSHEEKVRVYLHELSHIMNDDFSKADVQSVEYEAHKRDKEGGLEDLITHVD